MRVARKIGSGSLKNTVRTITLHQTHLPITLTPMRNYHRFARFDVVMEVDPYLIMPVGTDAVSHATDTPDVVIDRIEKNISKESATAVG